MPRIILPRLQGFIWNLNCQLHSLLPAPLSALTLSWRWHTVFSNIQPSLTFPPSSLRFLLAALTILTLSSADWHACLSAVFFLSSLCCAPLNPSLMHLIMSRQSGCSWLIHSHSMPDRTALYVTLPSLLQSFVGSFQSWALGLMNMYPGLFSWQFWGSLTKRDGTALCGCLLDLTVTFFRSLLPLCFIFNRLYPQVRLAAPFERWHCHRSQPKSSLQLPYFVIQGLGLFKSHSLNGVIKAQQKYFCQMQTNPS